MTQYMLSVHHDVDEAFPPMEELQPIFEAVDRFNQTLHDSGAWVFGGGLMLRRAGDHGRRHRRRLVVTDGPFAETKEYLGGFWVIEAPDLDAALKLAERGLEGVRLPRRGSSAPSERPT